MTAVAKRLADKLAIHYTPKHGSRLTIAAIKPSVLNRPCLNRRISGAVMPRTRLTVWWDRRNAAGGRVNWRLTSADARIKRKRLFPTIQE